MKRTCATRTYGGGLSNKYARQLIALYKELQPGTPPPIPVDILTTASCNPTTCE